MAYAYHDNEILKELKIGEVYTEREIAGYVSFNKDAMVVSRDTSHFDAENEETKYRVVNVQEVYLHQNVDNDYLVPDKKKCIYTVASFY